MFNFHYDTIKSKVTSQEIENKTCLVTSLSSIFNHCFGSSSVARKAINSKAVSRVWRLEETKIKTGLAGEWLLIAVKVVGNGMLSHLTSEYEFH